MHPSPTPRRFQIAPGSEGAWVALYTDYDDFETAVHVYKRKTDALGTLLLRLPTSVRWFLTQRYQLRVSSPANVRHRLTQIPAEFAIEVVSSDMLGGEPQPSPRPCELLLAKITAHATGVPLRTVQHTERLGPVLRMAERFFGWAAPQGADAPLLPFDLTFERVYLGGIPSSVLWMLAYAALAILAASLVYTSFLRILRTVPDADLPPERRQKVE